MANIVSSRAAQEAVELSIVMPCLDEAETLETCVKKANSYLEDNGVEGEVIVADNGSTDCSQEIARSLGARVVYVPEQGYGNSLMGGIAAARGKYVIMGDADDSYDFLSLEPFLAKLREGYDLVMGNRFKGGIEPGDSPPLHRHFVNTVLSGIGHLFFRSPVGDVHCGLRGFNKESIQQLDLQAMGMEFASEMVVKATMHDLRIAEVPASLTHNGRSRPPHLNRWKDVWQYLRFLLVFSPRWLFFYPGILITLVGSAAMLAWIISGPIKIGHVGFDINTMLIAAMLIVLGIQIVYFAIFSKVYGVTTRLVPSNSTIDRFMGAFTLERGLFIGGVICLLGLSGLIATFVIWSSETFGVLAPSKIMRITIPSFALMVIGVQTIFASFFLSILDLKKGKEIKAGSIPARFSPFYYGSRLFSVVGIINETTSIIILLKDGARYLDDLVRVLASQTHQKDVELIVVDSGSSDGSVERLEELCERYGIELNLVTIEPHEFGHGKTRNFALDLARGEIVVTLSQDALPVSETWLDDLVRPLEDETVAGVFGRQIPRPGTGFCESHFYEVTYPLESRRIDGEDGSSFSNLQLFFSNVNGAIRKSLALAHPFRSDLVMSEDQFWGRAMLHRGYAIVYEPKATVLHSHSYTLAQLFKRYFKSGYSMRQMEMRGNVVRGGARTTLMLLEQVLFKCPWRLPEVIEYQATLGTAWLCGKHDLLPRRLRDSLLGL